MDRSIRTVWGRAAAGRRGVGDGVLHDLGDFIDDDAVDPSLRSDLGLLFLVTFTARRPVRPEAVPLALDYCFTRLAADPELRWIDHRYRRACADLGTQVVQPDHRLVVEGGRRRRGS